MGKHLELLEWGWTFNVGLSYPKTTDLQPAPREILKMMKLGCIDTCDRKKCTCRKSAMKCTIACKNCKRISCTNVDNEHHLDYVVENDEMI